jgi:hypothetical protein
VLIIVSWDNYYDTIMLWGHGVVGLAVYPHVNAT